MDNFKEFYHKRRKEINEKQNSLMMEMSIRIDDDNYSMLADNSFNPSFINFYMTDGVFQENVILGNRPFDVYLWQHYLIFISEEPYVAAMVGFDELPNNKIKMFFIDKAKGFINLMDHIFIDYLLERYGEIESDNVHTQKGFWFYQKLAGLQNVYNKYTFYIKSPDGEKQIFDPKEMETTFGYDEDNAGYTYILKKKIN